MADKDTQMVSLNEVLELVSRLPIGRVGGVIGGAGNPLAGCDYECGCNHSMCGCRGSVSKHDLDMVSRPEFERIRQARVDQLKEQLAMLEQKG